jgi:hypothetical protein
MARFISLSLLALFVLPLASHGVWWQLRDHASSWSTADWSSARVLVSANREREAVVHVMAGRTGRWKGIFAHHSWIVLKPRRAVAYRRYEVVGWGRPLRVDAYAPDARWFGHDPEIILTLRGPDAERIIPAIERAVADYPHAERGAYVLWPGPNSNTFIAHVARQVPQLAPALLPTALGKDFAGWPVYAGAAPSRTGAQLSIGGLLGLTIGWVEGLEINVLGLVAGIDVRAPALKLPGWGRLELGGWALPRLPTPTRAHRTAMAGPPSAHR